MCRHCWPWIAASRRGPASACDPRQPRAARHAKPCALPSIRRPRPDSARRPVTRSTRSRPRRRQGSFSGRDCAVLCGRPCRGCSRFSRPSGLAISLCCGQASCASDLCATRTVSAALAPLFDAWQRTQQSALTAPQLRLTTAPAPTNSMHTHYYTPRFGVWRLPNGTTKSFEKAVAGQRGWHDAPPPRPLLTASRVGWRPFSGPHPLPLLCPCQQVHLRCRPGTPRPIYAISVGLIAVPFPAGHANVFIGPNTAKHAMRAGQVSSANLNVCATQNCSPQPSHDV